jgi:PhzF family phenazine biosynthesis protein
MKSTRCFQVNASPSGVSAAIRRLSACSTVEADPSWMQAIAAEMNLSETAFVRASHEGFHLRWFTPKVEVDLCGHATLAAAHVLWSEQLVGKDQAIRFLTKNGPLICTAKDGGIELDFPATPARAIEAPRDLLEALNVRPEFVGRSPFDYLLAIESADVLRSLTPDFRRLTKLDVRGVIVTAVSDNPRFDFLSRFFAPAAGVDEDPVTGSAHCCLGPFWAERLKKTEMVGYQASARGGVVRVRVAADRVILGGQAITIWLGELV